MIGIDLIGAGEGLATRTILLRIKKIDADKLKKALAGKSWGGAALPVIETADKAPALAFSIAIPFAKHELEKLGIETEISTTEAAVGVKASGEVRNTILVGVAIGAILAFGAGPLYRLVRRRQA